MPGRLDVIGQTITLDDERHEIVGILPPDTKFPLLEDVQVWRPVHVDPRDDARRDWRGFLAFARLRDGASIETARSEVAAVAAAIQRDHFPDLGAVTLLLAAAAVACLVPAYRASRVDPIVTLRAD